MEIFSGMAIVTSNAEEVEVAIVRLVGDPGTVTEAVGIIFFFVFISLSSNL